MDEAATLMTRGYSRSSALISLASLFLGKCLLDEVMILEAKLSFWSWKITESVSRRCYSRYRPAAKRILDLRFGTRKSTIAAVLVVVSVKRPSTSRTITALIWRLCQHPHWRSANSGAKRTPPAPPADYRKMYSHNLKRKEKPEGYGFTHSRRQHSVRSNLCLILSYISVCECEIL